MKSDPEKPIPPIQRHTIDLRSLTKEEEAIIRTVLERDFVQTEIIDNKLSGIRHDIQEIRKRGALAQGDNPNTMCARCKHKFWLLPLPLTDRGARCVKCKFRVCRACRSKEFNGTWMCSLCLRYREEKILSGEWMLKGLGVGLHGSDLMRASLRDKEHVQAIEKAQLKEMTRIAEKQKRASKNIGERKSKTKRRRKSPTDDDTGAVIRNLLDGIGDPNKGKKDRKPKRDGDKERKPKRDPDKEKEKARTKRDGDKERKPKKDIGVAKEKKNKLDENQSWRRDSETKKLTTSLNVGQVSETSNIVSQVPCPIKSNHSGMLSKLKQFIFTRGKGKPDYANKMPNYSPQSERNVFSLQEMNTNNHDNKPISEGEKKVDEVTGELDAKHRLRSNGIILKKPIDDESKPTTSKAITLPPGLRQFVGCVRKQRSNTRLEKCVLSPKESYRVNIDVPCIDVKKDCVRFQKGTKGEASKASYSKTNRFLPTSISNINNAGSLKNQSSATACPHNELSNIRFPDGEDDILLKTNAYNEIHNELEEGYTNPRHSISTNKAPKIRVCHYEDTIKNTTIDTNKSEPSQAATRSLKNSVIYLLRPGPHKEDPSASGDGIFFSDISAANINVNFQPSRTVTVKNKEAGDRTSRVSSRANVDLSKLPQDRRRSMSSKGNLLVRSPSITGNAVELSHRTSTNKPDEDPINKTSSTTEQTTTTSHPTNQPHKDELERRDSKRGLGAARLTPRPSIMIDEVKDAKKSKKKRKNSVTKKTDVRVKDENVEKIKSEPNLDNETASPEVATKVKPASTKASTNCQACQTRVRKRSKVVKALCPFCKFSMEYGAEF